MQKQQIQAWVAENKKGVLIGFILGAVIFPLLSVFGLVIPFFENIRPILIGPFDLLSWLIPNIRTGPNSYYVPFYKWVLTLVFNGVCYALPGGFIQQIMRRKTR